MSRWHIQPSEFWRMSMDEIWALVKAANEAARPASGLTDAEVRRMWAELRSDQARERVEQGR